MPKSQLFCMGTLMRLAMGFWSFFASSAALACSSDGAAPSPSAARTALSRCQEVETVRPPAVVRGEPHRALVSSAS